MFPCTKNAWSCRKAAVKRNIVLLHLLSRYNVHIEHILSHPTLKPASGMGNGKSRMQRPVIMFKPSQWKKKKEMGYYSKISVHNVCQEWPSFFFYCRQQVRKHHIAMVSHQHENDVKVNFTLLGFSNIVDHQPSWSRSFVTNMLYSAHE